MATPTTPAAPAGRSRSEILVDLANCDERWRISTNACRDVDTVTYKRYRSDGTTERVCVSNPLDLRSSGRKGVSAGRGPLPTQRCTTAKRAESTQIGQGGQ